MPVTKNPYLRYRILNACFTNKQKRFWTKKELTAKLEENDLPVEPRTLNRDLESMRHDNRLGYHAPISFSRSEQAYYYKDPDFSIDAMRLSDEEIRSLSMAVHLLEHYKGTQVLNEFKGAIDKVVRAVNGLKYAHAGDGVLMEPERAPYYKGINYVEVLLDAIARRQPLCIAYQKFTVSHPEDHVMHPYFLKEYKQRWYVLGYSDTRGMLLTLALDRIEGIEKEQVVFKENQWLTPEAYFGDTIGISHSAGPAECVVLWFPVHQGCYIKTQHLHHSQVVLGDDDSGLTIQLLVTINFELLSVLLSYCPHIKVLKPLKLKEKLNKLMRLGLEVNS